MMKIRINKEQITNLIERFKKKARIVIINEESFEHKRDFMLSPLNFLVLILFFTLLIVVSTYFIIAYTPIRQSIPGMPNLSQEMVLRKIDQENIRYLDKVKHQSEVEELYYQNLISIFSDETPFDPTSQDSTYNRDSLDYSNITFSISKEDSVLREKIDLREKYALHGEQGRTIQNDDMKGVFFFTPLNGIISESINPKDGHFGVDIVAPKDEAIRATLDGAVVFKDWTPEYGHIIYLQHSNNLISVYKHNSFVFKKVGETVQAGEPIAIIGNSGRLSTGPHLHFEIWHKGVPLNPEDYMRFSE